MTSCVLDKLGLGHGLLDHIMPIIYQHLSAVLIVAAVLVAAFFFRFRLRRHRHTSLPDTESWLEDEKTLFEEPPPLPDLVADYSHPLAQALFQQSGIPTSGDLVQREQLNSSNLAHSPFPISVPTSGDLAALAPPSTEEERRHPWRRHSHPEPKCSDGNLNHYQTEAVIMEDAVDFFRDDKSGKLWRRRTIEFGTAR
jgi:hypothetical protein